MGGHAVNPTTCDTKTALLLFLLFCETIVTAWQPLDIDQLAHLALAE